MPVTTLTLFLNGGKRKAGGSGLTFLMRAQKQHSKLANYWISAHAKTVDKDEVKILMPACAAADAARCEAMC